MALAYAFQTCSNDLLFRTRHRGRQEAGDGGQKSADYRQLALGQIGLLSDRKTVMLLSNF